MKNKIFKGYIASRNIRELQIPQRIQNMVIRNYAEKRGKVFSLSATEYIMDNCFMMLYALLKEGSQYEAITFYSMFMLPNNKEERLHIYDLALQVGTELHFAYEELFIATPNDVNLIEDILLAKDLSNLTKDGQWAYNNS